MDDFYLFANCNFVPDRYPDWQAAYEDLATYVYASESSTKSYYFGIPLDYAYDFSKTTSMLAFEVYGTRNDLYKTHLASPAMTGFLQEIPSASTTGLDLNHYRCLAGFLDLSSTKAPAAIMQDIRITCHTPSSRSHILSSLTTLIDNIHNQERLNGGRSGVLTYMAFESLDNDVGVRLFGRWKTREDLEAFIRKADVVGFWMREKQGMKGMEQRLYVPNGKGWLHRGSGSGFAGERRRGGKETL